ncbi:MAG: hypothetical protein SFV24_19180 [Gemmatimonadales bacterium]|nr:hypothetical protein [Gemmatimonadales bacterium]
MKLIALALLLLWGAVGEAAIPIPCYPSEATARKVTITTAPTDPMEWLAAPATPGLASQMLSWYCDMKYYWYGVAWYGYKAELKPEWVSVMQGAPTYDAAKWKVLIDENSSCEKRIYPETDPCAAYNPLIPWVDWVLKTGFPPRIIWRVKDNPTSTSRPVFPLNAGGTRSTTATAERVGDADLCNCVEKALEESGGTYCSVAGRPDVARTPAGVIAPGRVALCARVN